MTDIEWCQNPDGTKGKTWNPTRGCSRCSPGCDACYAMRFAHRFSGEGGVYEGLTILRPKGSSRPGVDWAGRARFVPEMLLDPRSWRKPQRIFVNSMSDLFHESLSWEREIDRVFEVMEALDRHTFQVLTKRPRNMLDYVQDRYRRAQARPVRNIWLGVSVEDQASADERIPPLLEAVGYTHFVSAEPLLGPLDLARHLKPTLVTREGRRLQHPQHSDIIPSQGGTWEWGLDWVIVGGESGSGARPFDSSWAESIVKQCAAAKVPAFVKQLGGNHFAPWKVKWTERHDGSFDASSSDRVGTRGASFATVWPNGVWHTWDAQGIGGENSQEGTVEDAKREALKALQRQHVSPIKDWARHAHMLRDRKGGDMTEWAEGLRIRQFPNGDI